MTLAYNRLEFTIGTIDGEQFGRRGLEIRVSATIDGVPLFGSPSACVDEGALLDSLSGGDEFPILSCQCGIWECGGFAPVAVEFKPDAVTWRCVKPVIDARFQRADLLAAVTGLITDERLLLRERPDVHGWEGSVDGRRLRGWLRARRDRQGDDAAPAAIERLDTTDTMLGARVVERRDVHAHRLTLHAARAESGPLALIQREVWRAVAMRGDWLTWMEVTDAPGRCSFGELASLAARDFERVERAAREARTTPTDGSSSSD